MFATLDPIIRSVTLPSKRKALLSDTVGFIRNLPHTLVSAFRATLEEVQRAELLLHVVDIISPYAHEQEKQVERVLEELEAQKQKRIRVLNKIDLLPPRVRSELRDTPGTVHVSARSGAAIGRLLEAIDENLQGDPLCRVRLRIPQHEGKALSMLQAGARIYARKYRDGVLEAEAEMPQSLARKFESFRVP
jgi:GTP-binding protein HflX